MSKSNFYIVLSSIKNKLPIYKLPLSSDIESKLYNEFVNRINSMLNSKNITAIFDGSFKPADNMLNKIPDYKLPPEIIKAIQEPNNVSDFIPEEELLLNIRGVFTNISDENKTLIGFQNITRSNFVTKKNMHTLLYNGKYFEKISGYGFNISKEVDMVYTEKKLLFNNYWTARQILNLSDYYRLATHNDLKKFVEHTAICVENKEKILEISDSWIRQKIALLLDSNILDKCEVKEIVSVAKEYGFEIKLSTKNQIILPEDRQILKDLLRFLDEDFFIGPLTNQLYQAGTKMEFK